MFAIKQSIHVIYKALGDNNRLKIIELLVAGERCVCELQPVVDCAPSTLSHHLKILEQVGVISSQKRGKWRYYHLCPTFVTEFLQANLALFLPKSEQENDGRGKPHGCTTKLSCC